MSFTKNSTTCKMVMEESRANILHRSSNKVQYSHIWQCRIKILNSALFSLSRNIRPCIISKSTYKVWLLPNGIILNVQVGWYPIQNYFVFFVFKQHSSVSCSIRSRWPLCYALNWYYRKVYRLSAVVKLKVRYYTAAGLGQGRRIHKW